MKKQDKGITLIALVITIIILLILAGISITSLTGNKLFEKAKESKEKSSISEVKEKIELLINEYQIEKVNSEELNLYDYFNEKKENGELDTLKDNGDGTIKVGLKGYVVNINAKDLMVMNIEKSDNDIEISYVLTPYENNKFKVLIKIVDKTNRIQTIEYPDGDIQRCNGIEEVAIDYEIDEGKDYIFIAKNLKGMEKTLVINSAKVKIPEKPEITVIKNSGYPVYGPNGATPVIENGVVRITCSSNNELIQILYSENKGSDWKLYKGELETSAMEIMAKSVIVYEDGVSIESDVAQASLYSR